MNRRIMNGSVICAKKQYTNREELKEHEYDYHEQKCDRCEKRYVNIKELGEHLKTTQRIINDETREYEYRLFDLEVIATEENGVWFQVWSFSFAHFCDDGEYHDAINHGVSYVDLSSCGCVLTVLAHATSRYVDSQGGLQRSYTRKPYLANR